MRVPSSQPRYVPIRLASSDGERPGLLQTAMATVAATAHRWIRVWASIVETLASAAAVTAYVRNLVTVARLYARLAPAQLIAATSEPQSAGSSDGLADVLPERSSSSDDESGQAQAGSAQEASTPPVLRPEREEHLRSLLVRCALAEPVERDARGMRSFSDGDLEASGRVRWRATDSEPQELAVSDEHENRRLVVYRHRLIPHSRAMTFLDDRIAEISRRVDYFERRRAEQEAQQLVAAAAANATATQLPQITAACPSGHWTPPQDGLPQGTAGGRPQAAPPCAQQ